MDVDRYCWIGLGANLGSVAASLRAARLALRALAHGPLVCSPLVWTAPWGRGDQPDFLNQVVGLQPRFDPDGMLVHLQAIERAHGRQREEPWGPRTLDLDLLSWPVPVVTGPSLVLPHPHLHLRRFVLAPWAAVAPELVLPGLGSVAALLAACPDGGALRWCSSL